MQMNFYTKKRSNPSKLLFFFSAALIILMSSPTVQTLDVHMGNPFQNEREAHRESNHPFVGAHADKSQIKREDGSIATKLKHKDTTFHKYKSLIDTSSPFFQKSQAENSFGFMLKNAIFGQSEAAIQSTPSASLSWQREVQRFMSWKQSEWMAKNGKSASEYQAENPNRLRDGSQGKSIHKLAQNTNNYFTSLLETVDGTIWTGEIYMGKLSMMDVVYDTGSDWLVVEGSTCTNCQGNTYDPTWSTDSVKVDQKETRREYGSASLAGNVYQDTVCILLSTCVQDYEYFLISDQKGISEPIDGILGLSRDDNLILAEEGTEQNKADLYVRAMVRQGLITEPTFSFFFQRKGYTSYMDFGPAQTANMRDPAMLRSVKHLKDFFWAQYNQGVGVGGKTDVNVWGYEDAPEYMTVKNNAMYSVVDTGSSAINFSSLYFEDLIYKIYEKVGGNEYQFQQGVLLTKCYTNFPKLYFQMDMQFIEVDPQDYVFDASRAQDKSVCVLLIVPAQMPIHVIGMPLFIDYYTVHNLDTHTIDYVPLAGSSKNALEKATKLPSRFLKKSAGGQQGLPFDWLIIIEAVFLLAAGVAYYYLLYPELMRQYPDQLWAIIGISAAYFVGVIVILIWVLPLMEPLFTTSFYLNQINKEMLGSENLFSFAVLAAIIAFFVLVMLPKAQTKSNVTTVQEKDRDMQTLLNEFLATKSSEVQQSTYNIVE